MATGYYDEDGLWIAAFEEARFEEQLADILTSLATGFELMRHEREFLVLAGYDPDTGEYNED